MIACTKEPKGFRQIGQLVRPVYHRLQFAGLEQLIHVVEVLVGSQPDETKVLVVQPGGERTHDQGLQQARDAAADGDIGAVGIECPKVGKGRTVRFHIEDEVVTSATLGEVLLEVINHVGRAHGTQHVQFSELVDHGHLNAVKFGYLQGECAN